MGNLSAATVKALAYPAGKKRPVRFGDGGGLYLQVAKGGSKSWLLRPVVEHALAHTNNNTSEAAYARSDLLEKRRPLMTGWAEH